MRLLSHKDSFQCVVRGWPLWITLPAFWPAWKWYFERMTDRSDESWGWIALVTAFFFLARSKHPEGQSRPEGPFIPALLCASVFSLGYAVTYPFCPNLVKTLLAVFSFGFILRAQRGDSFCAGIWGLLLLGLPVFSSLQFFLGYPLRRGVAFFASQWLKIQGFRLTLEGTCLVWGERLIEIDAACSGIKMMWAGMYLAFTLSAAYRLKMSGVVRMTIFSFLVVVFGNVLRASALFYVEAGLFPLPSWGHPGIGTVSFLITASLIFLLFLKSEKKSSLPLAPLVQVQTKSSRWSFWVYLSCSLLAFFSPWLSFWNRPSPEITSVRFPGFPASFEGRKLVPLVLSPREERFYRDFPGQIGRFQAGKDEIVFRWFERRSRKVHPASDCFKGLGYTIDPLPLWKDSKGRRWGCFLATGNGKRLRVLEMIHDEAGKSWSDVPSWYWAALLDKSEGPWWAITRARTEE